MNEPRTAKYYTFKCNNKPRYGVTSLTTQRGRTINTSYSDSQLNYTAWKRNNKITFVIFGDATFSSLWYRKIVRRLPRFLL